MEPQAIIYRAEATGIIGALADIFVELRSIRDFSKMKRKRKRTTIWTSDAEREAWDAHVDGTIRELRDLAARGRAELGIPEPADAVTFLRELEARSRAELAPRQAP